MGVHAGEKKILAGADYYRIAAAGNTYRICARLRGGPVHLYLILVPLAAGESPRGGQPNIVDPDSNHLRGQLPHPRLTACVYRTVRAPYRCEAP